MRTGVSWGLLRLLTPLLLLGCGQREPRSPPSSPPQEIPELVQLVKSAPTIVVGRVARIRPGRVAGPPEDRLQFEDVLVTVEEHLKGEPKPATLLLEQVESRGRVLLDFEPYRPEQRLVLFVRPGEGGHYVALPQGRYRIEGDVVRAAQPGTLADKVDGMRLEQFRGLIRSATR